MQKIADFLQLMRESDEIEIIRFEDRFKQPALGWRDAMINFCLKNSSHVCEVQIVHAKMLLQRKYMGGHHSYSHERNAAEIAEYISAMEE